MKRILVFAVAALVCCSVAIINGAPVFYPDSIGYLGSCAVLLTKELGHPTISWTDFFKQGVMVVGGVGALCATLSLLYFLQSARNSNLQEKPTGELIVNPA